MMNRKRNRIAAAAAAALLCQASAPVWANAPDAELTVGTATVSAAGTDFTDDPGNTGFAAPLTSYGSVLVVDTTLTLQGYQVKTLDDYLNYFNVPVEQRNGGVINQLSVIGANGVANIDGGQVGGNAITIAPLGTLNVTAGILGRTTLGVDATMNFSGGVIPRQGAGFRDYGVANISGGFVLISVIFDSGEVNVSGGEIMGTNRGYINVGGVLNLAGGTQSSASYSFSTFDDGLVDLFGTFDGFKDGDTIGPGQVGSFTGTLAAPGSTPVTFDYDTTLGGSLEFNVGTFPGPLGGAVANVPEPAEIWLMAIGLACLVGRSGGGLMAGARTWVAGLPRNGRRRRGDQALAALTRATAAVSFLP